MTITWNDTVARFGVDFNKDEYNKWVQSHIKCVACGGSYFERNERHEISETLINRRRQHDVPKCSVRLYHPKFIYI